MILDGQGPANRILAWLAQHPTPDGWRGTAMDWAALEMPLSELLAPADRWPLGLHYLQAAIYRPELLDTWKEAAERIAQAAPDPTAEYAGAPLVELPDVRAGRQQGASGANSEGER